MARDLKQLADILQHLPSVITAAAVSPRGILALMIVGLLLLALVWFGRAPIKIRLAVFASMFLGAVAYVSAGYEAYQKDRTWNISQHGGPGWSAAWPLKFDGQPFDCPQVHTSGSRLTATCRAFQTGRSVSILKYDVSDGNSCAYFGQLESSVSIAGYYYCKNTEKPLPSWTATTE
jgi:energy-coupling factor transporter transmembrane protein EcfT